MSNQALARQCAYAHWIVSSWRSRVRRAVNAESHKNEGRQIPRTQVVFIMYCLCDSTVLPVDLCDPLKYSDTLI